MKYELFGLLGQLGFLELLAIKIKPLFRFFYENIRHSRIKIGCIFIILFQLHWKSKDIEQQITPKHTFNLLKIDAKQRLIFLNVLIKLYKIDYI